MSISTISTGQMTLDQILDLEYCSDYDEDRIQELADGFGKTEITALEVLDLPIPAQDRLWLVLREEFICERDLHLLACDFAERVLPIFERRHPIDSRPRNAIDAKRRWVRGDATDAARAAARAAARDAAWDAAWDAQIEIVRSAVND